MIEGFFGGEVVVHEHTKEVRVKILAGAAAQGFEFFEDGRFVVAVLGEDRLDAIFQRNVAGLEFVDLAVETLHLFPGQVLNAFVRLQHAIGLQEFFAAVECELLVGVDDAL